MPHVTRDESAEAGYHYRLELNETAVEVDLFRLLPLAPEVFVEVFGRRGEDGHPDSVTVAVPLERVQSLAGALMDVYRKGKAMQDKAQAQADAAEEAKKKGPFK